MNEHVEDSVTFDVSEFAQRATTARKPPGRISTPRSTLWLPVTASQSAHSAHSLRGIRVRRGRSRHLDWFTSSPGDTIRADLCSENAARPIC